MPWALWWWLPQPHLQVRHWWCSQWEQVQRSCPTTLPLARLPQRPHIRQPWHPPSQPHGQAQGLLTLLHPGGLHTNQAASRLQDGVWWHTIWEQHLLQVRCQACGCRGISCSAGCGPCSPSDRLSHGSDSGASSLPLRMPLFGASRGTNINLDETLASGSIQHGITNIHI